MYFVRGTCPPRQLPRHSASHWAVETPTHAKASASLSTLRHAIGQSIVARCAEGNHRCTPKYDRPTCRQVDVLASSPLAEWDSLPAGRDDPAAVESPASEKRVGHVRRAISAPSCTAARQQAPGVHRRQLAAGWLCRATTSTRCLLAARGSVARAPTSAVRC